MQGLWERTSGRLREGIGPRVVDAWFGAVRFEGLDHGVARLSVPTAFLRGRVGLYGDDVLSSLRGEAGEPVDRLSVRVRSPVIAVRLRPRPVAPTVPAEPPKPAWKTPYLIEIPPRKAFPISLIIKVAALEWGLTPEELLDRSRKARVVEARQVVAFLAHTMTKLSLPEIGRRMGGRDHTTILWAVRSAKKKMETNPEFAAHVLAVEARLKQQMPLLGSTTAG